MLGCGDEVTDGKIIDIYWNGFTKQLLRKPIKLIL
jgi:hypothetical protein